jgi:glycosidase
MIDRRRLLALSGLAAASAMTGCRADRSAAAREGPSRRPSAVTEPAARASWVRDAVIYGVVPPLFGSRPFEAVTTALPRLARLGVSVLWLAPVFDCTPGDYGYEVTDLFAIRRDWGTEAELKRLVTRAHDHDLKVILDLPLNDTSSRAAYFRDAQRRGRRSPYYNFYERNAAGAPEHYFTWQSLPNLNYDDPRVRAMATDAALHWLDRLGHDGYRLDAAWGIQRRTPGFWAAWTATVRTAKPDVLLLAEGSATQAVWATAGFDLAYDWTAQLGRWHWAGAFASPNPAVGLRRALAHRPRTTPLRYLDDNDTGRRFIATHGIGMTRAATAALMTLDGVPEIFTGSEIGARYLPYQRTRPLPWRTDRGGLEEFHRRVIRLRRRTPQLTGDGLAVLPPRSAHDPVLAFRRWAHDLGAAVDVAVNFSARPAPAVLQGSEILLPPWGHDLA